MCDVRRLSILLELAKLEAHSEPCQITSEELGEKIGCAQQTAARWLTKLSEEGLIDQDVGSRGQTISLTSEGIDVLRSLRKDLNEVLGEVPQSLKLTGRIVSGLGEGSYYVDREEYKKQFKEKLGFNPYPGTLDIKLDNKSLRIKERLHSTQGKRIEGFSTQKRRFGGGKCFSARVGDMEAGIILPDRTHHKKIIEVIAPEKLRDKFSLEDDDEITVEVEV